MGDGPLPHSCSDSPGMARRLGAVHDSVLEGMVHDSGSLPKAGARDVICESWRRSLAAGVTPEVTAAPLVYDADRIGDARAQHPLDPHLPMLRSTLRGAADATSHLMVITDEDGHVLWSEGTPQILRKAALIGLREGFCWSEGSVGTNGIGTALSAGRSAYVYSAEHLARALHAWSCAASTITDPDSGRIIGCIDISATIRELHPATVALVDAAARLAEARLALEMHTRDDRLRTRYRRHLGSLRGQPGALVTPTGRILATEPAGWWTQRIMLPDGGGPLLLPNGRTAVAEPLGDLFLLRALDLLSPELHRPLLSLHLLGDPPEARLDGRSLPLSRRHAEILALLALNPRGLNADQCSYHLYGDEGNPVTLRAEIHRLRAQLGTLVLAKPYRLNCDVDADFLTVRRLLAEGAGAAAARLYRGPLLPRSESPTIRTVRDELAAQLRRQLLDCGGPDALWAYAETEDGHEDLEVLTRLVTLLPTDDARHISARLRRKRLT
jgi:hypothetical protein